VRENWFPVLRGYLRGENLGTEQAMRLTVLGCRSGMPSGGCCSSSYLATTGSTNILMDCGPGAATALSAHGPGTMLNGVVVSHMHMDHVFDLLVLGKSNLAGKIGYASHFPGLPADHFPMLAAPIPLYVPVGAGEILQKLAGLFPVATIPILDKAFSAAFEIHEYRPGDSFLIGDCKVSMHELRHAVPNCGTRLESAGGSIAYTGDTGMTDDLLPFARDVDLLLCEATFERPEAGNHGHLCAAEAGAVAREAGVGELVLTHFVTDYQPWLEARRADAGQLFEGRIHLAAPGRTFDISGR
jgi:ribonuclease BN (tRNA processing enzyme)